MAGTPYLLIASCSVSVHLGMDGVPDILADMKKASSPVPQAAKNCPAFCEGQHQAEHHHLQHHAERSLPSRPAAEIRSISSSSESLSASRGDLSAAFKLVKEMREEVPGSLERVSARLLKRSLEEATFFVLQPSATVSPCQAGLVPDEIM